VINTCPQDLPEEEWECSHDREWNLKEEILAWKPNICPPPQRGKSQLMPEKTVEITWNYSEHFWNCCRDWSWVQPQTGNKGH